MAAAETLHVGDRVLEDYEGPRRLGMQAVLCTALARTPSAAELQKFKNLMAEATTDKKANRREVLEDLFWAVLTSKEFLFNR